MSNISFDVLISERLRELCSCHIILSFAAVVGDNAKAGHWSDTVKDIKEKLC